MTNETQEQETKRNISEKLAELLKQGLVVPIEAVKTSRLKALAVYNGMMRSRGDYSHFVFKYAVVNNPSITKTTKGNYVLEGEIASEIWQSETYNSWFYRKFFGQPESFIDWSIREGPSETGSLVKLLQEGDVIIPLYE